jgi:periplasmic divalent cation tolerance protein
MTTTNDDRPDTPVRQMREQPADQSSQRTNAILVYTTFPTVGDAKKAAHALVTAGLAACVNLIEQMSAIYVWEGNIEEDSEVVMIVKTTESRRDDVLEEIKRLHPFSTPSRLVLPVIGGGEDFLAWIEAQCRPKRESA